MKELSDPNLARLVQATHDADGYAILVARHRPALMAFLYRLAGDDMNIDDVAQNALIRGYEKIDQFRYESSFRTWLFEIAYTQYLQLLRHRKAVDRLKINVSQRDQSPVVPDMDFSIDLKRALSMLTHEERAALLLCDAHGFSHREAAKTMKAPLGSLKTYVQRARNRMRVALKERESHHDR